MSMWTQFWDMNSGGGRKEKWAHIYIEAPEADARVIFYNRFGHNPDRVSCTCCGADYSISSEESLAHLTGYHRNCDNLDTPRDGRGLYKKVDDPWYHEHYYLEPGEEDEARRRGYDVRQNTARSIGVRHGSDYGAYKTLDQYCADPDVLVIRASEIKPEERIGNVPEQGYVWVE